MPLRIGIDGNGEDRGGVEIGGNLGARSGTDLRDAGWLFERNQQLLASIGAQFQLHGLLQNAATLLRVDPAIATGPLVTTLVDIMGILIYFNVARALVVMTVASATGGILLGSFVGSIISGNLDETQLQTWGWRLPFLFGVLVAGMGYLIRRHMPETLKEENKADNPLKHLWEDRKEVLRVSALNLLTAVAFYAIFVFAVTWLVKYVKEPRTVALQLNTMSMVVLMFAVPFFAWLSDRVGRKPILIAGAAGMVLFSYPLIWLMHHHNDAMILCGQMGLAILLSAYIGPVPATLAEMFSSKIRVTAVSVGYNLTYAIFGGTTPMVAVWLIEKEHSDMSFAWYIVAAAAISLVVTLWIKDGAHKPLPE